MRTVQDIFIDNLKNLRNEKELTQAKLAEKAGVSIALIAEIEIGKRNPTLSTIGKIAIGLGVKPHVLLLDRKATAEEMDDAKKEEMKALLQEMINEYLS